MKTFHALCAIAAACAAALALAPSSRAAAAVDTREITIVNGSRILIRPYWTDLSRRVTEEGDPINQGSHDMRRLAKSGRTLVQIYYWDARDLSGGMGTSWNPIRDCKVELTDRPDQVTIEVTGRFGSAKCEVR